MPVGSFALILLVYSALGAFRGTAGEILVPPLNEVKGIQLRVEVDKGRDGVFRYRYFLENSSSQEASWAILYLPSFEGTTFAAHGLAATLGLWGHPSFWQALYPEGYQPIALWSHPIPPGGSFAAATVESRFPPGLVEVLLDPGNEEVYKARVQEALGRECVPKNQEMLRWRLADRHSLWVLGPVPYQAGTYQHWDLVQNTFQRMETLGWLSPEVGGEIQAHLLAGRSQAFSRDRSPVFHALAKVESLLNVLPEPIGDIALDFFSPHQELLRQRPCPPSGPFLTAFPQSAEAVLGDVVSLRFSLRDQATLAPLEGRNLLLEVLEGPRKGWQETAVTDGKGEALFLQQGIAKGREEICLRLLGQEKKAPAQCLARISISWLQGPNLQISFLSGGPFAEPFWPLPGDWMRIRECTRNTGDVGAPASETSFWLRPAEGSGEGILVARRPVPPLPPNGYSCLMDAKLVIPAGIPKGKYILEAQADARGEVVESEEEDNREAWLPEGFFPLGLTVPQMQTVAPSGAAPPKPQLQPSHVPSLPGAPPPGTVAWLEGPLTVWPEQTGESVAFYPGTKCSQGRERPAGMAPAGGDETYAYKREQLPEGLLRQVVGKVTVTTSLWEMESRGRIRTYDAGTIWETVQVEIYEEGQSGFELKEVVPAARLKPFSSTSFHEDASIIFFATARKGEFVETVLDTETGKRGWLRVSPERAWLGLLPGDKGYVCSYDCLSGECAKEFSSHPDWSVLNPHPMLPLHLTPDPRSPWVPFQDFEAFVPEELCEDQDVSTWNLFMGEQVGGFVRIFLWDEKFTAGRPGKTLGWLPIRDQDGSLLLWPVGYFC